MEQTAMKANSCVEHTKIKTHFARIIVVGSPEKPIYNIMYFDPADGEYHIGFGSYSMEFVFNWLAEEFEIVGDAFSNEPVRHGEWKGHGNFIECSECGNDYPKYDWGGSVVSYYYCPNCGAKMYGGNDGAAD